MRALLALLLLANVAFFALTRGWLEPYVGLSTQHEREPQRLAAQLNPDSVSVLDANATGSAVIDTSNASQCVQAGPFTAKQIDAAESALAAAQWPGLVWRRVEAAPPPLARSASAPGSAGGAFWLRVDAADAAQRERLLSLTPGQAGQGFQSCP